MSQRAAGQPLNLPGLFLEKNYPTKERSFPARPDPAEAYAGDLVVVPSLLELPALGLQRSPLAKCNSAS
jgi:hypothetical protein